jgi:hypothetical protein
MQTTCKVVSLLSKRERERGEIERGLASLLHDRVVFGMAQERRV